MPPPIAPPQAAPPQSAAPVHPPAALAEADAPPASKPGAPQLAKPAPPVAHTVVAKALGAAASAKAPAKPEPHVWQPAPAKALVVPAGAPPQAEKPEAQATQPPPGKASVSLPPPIDPAPIAKPEVRSEPKVDQAAAPVPAPGALKPVNASETPPSDKASDNADDPFAGLGSLEEEMARLLGRERMN
jgi:hypothetical protein